MVSLNEYKNISDDVYQFSVDLYHKILNDADIRQMQKSRVNGFLFVQNTLLLNNTNVKWIFNNIDSLKVNYILYVSETTKEYNYIMQNIDADANSESDYDNKSITIVSGYIDDYISPDFLSNICHEVNHLYEYDNGREKRVDLYDKVRELFTKIKNAYLRYKLENRQMTEGAIHRLQKNEKIRLEECKKYNQDITWGLEIIYNF